MADKSGFNVTGVFVPIDEVEWRFTAAGGPGGQHANRSNTAATAVFDIASSTLPPHVKDRLIPKLGRVVSVRADERRSQTRNREAAVERLEERLNAALVRPKARRSTKPTRGSQRRRVETKRRRGETKRLRRPPTDD